MSLPENPNPPETPSNSPPLSGRRARPSGSAPLTGGEPANSALGSLPVKGGLGWFLKNKYFLIILSFIIVIPLFIGLMSAINSNNNTIIQTQEKPIATVGDKQIYYDDIKKVALEINPASANDDKTIREAFNKLTERLILEQEAKRLEITISDEQTEERIVTLYPTPREVSDKEKKELKQTLLKEKIMEQAIESREAYSIRAELPPYSQFRDKYTMSQLEFFEKQKEQIDTMLPDAEQRLRHGEIFLNLVQSIYHQYPDLQQILEVNGKYIERKTDPKDDRIDLTFTDPELKHPRLYRYDKSKVGELLYDTIFALQPNEIKLLDHQSNPGGYVVMVIKINNQRIFSYNDWLSAKRKELVKTYISI